MTRHLHPLTRNLLIDIGQSLALLTIYTLFIFLLFASCGEPGL